MVDEWRARLDTVLDETGAYWTDQLTNADALDGYASLGAELLADAPDVTDFVMGAGTGECAMGTARALRSERDVRVTLLEPAESPYLSAGRGGDHGVEGLAVVERPPLLYDDLYDAVVPVPEDEARSMARRLAAGQGVFVGISTGLNVAAAVDVAAGRDSGDVVTTVACDTGLKYLSGSLFTG